jgi:hypothetical protein
MSDAPYQKECTYCKNKITMSKESGNWLPYELNSDKKHDCRNKEVVDAKAPDTKQQQFNHKDVITLEQVLAKLKLIGVEVNLDLLLKETNGKK